MEALLKNKSLLVMSILLMTAGCAPSKQSLKQALIDNPDILTEAIEKNSLKIMEALNKAAQSARAEQAKKTEEESAQQMEQEFKNPKTPVIDEARAIRGPKDAPIMMVEYSDFECPYCRQGYETVKQVHDKYGDKVRFEFKNLPLPFHPHAMIGARYYEAIALQSAEKAYKYHDAVFAGQDKVRDQGEKFFESVAKSVGADMKKVKADLNGDKVTKRIEEDKAEAAKFEFSGTPGFLLNGVSLRGAYPLPEFEKIIDRLLKDKGGQPAAASSTDMKPDAAKPAEKKIEAKSDAPATDTKKAE
jgi:protein-disulfide isomerase